jgi:hypothetical protein
VSYIFCSTNKSTSVARICFADGCLSLALPCCWIFRHLNCSFSRLFARWLFDDGSHLLLTCLRIRWKKNLDSRIPRSLSQKKLSFRLYSTVLRILRRKTHCDFPVKEFRRNSSRSFRGFSSSRISPIFSNSSLARQERSRALRFIFTPQYFSGRPLLPYPLSFEPINSNDQVDCR